MAFSNTLYQALGYGFLCTASLAIGGAVAAFRSPSDTLRGYIQHVAAGLVFAAAGVEVLPDVMHREKPLAAAIGFALGIVLLLAIRAMSERLEKKGNSGPWAFLSVVVVDIFVDGLLIGVSTATQRGAGHQALLVTIALAVELLTLGLSLAVELGQGGTSRARSILTTSLVAVTPLFGAVAGYFLSGVLTGAWIEGVLAFAVAALLYLAAEELLTEAHELPETNVGTALFLSAFLVIMLIDMVTSPT
ncbi:ZIP family metal transporter [Noviherbaspirillum pedocola]|uniref:Transporter n=1 Tax=Noviherbaspirillum pedocola TaxID=2801341 RepID=A0A934ST21_9BURK|nr:transporter [Noviherbaspirillum pedocola]MBK4734676.1 transporter [Noviherbaspirillum pedocola]